MDDEGVLDPRVAEFFAANPMMGQPFEDFSPEMLALARGPVGAPPTRDIARVTDDVVDGIPVRIYQHDERAERARRLLPRRRPLHRQHRAHGQRRSRARALLQRGGRVRRVPPRARAPVSSRSRRLRDRHAVGARERVGARRVPEPRRRGGGERGRQPLGRGDAAPARHASTSPLAGQVLIYPGVDGNSWTHPSRTEFEGLVLTRRSMDAYWERYTGGATSATIPSSRRCRRRAWPTSRRRSSSSVAAISCATRAVSTPADSATTGVDVEEVCFPGQPHGFVNFQLPAAADAFERIGAWLRAVFARAGRSRLSAEPGRAAKDQRGRPRISAACSPVASGRPARSHSATASSTRSTLLGVRSPP